MKTDRAKPKKYMPFLSAALSVVNVLFMLIGCTVLGTALWIMLSKDFMSALIGTRLMTASLWILIVSGCGIVLVSILGYCAVKYMNKSLLLTERWRLQYICLVVVICLLLVIGGVVAIVFRLQVYGKFRINIREHMKRTLQDHYGVDLNNYANRAITEAWDSAQSELYCCAVTDHGWSAYRGSHWARLQPHTVVSSPEIDRLFVPKSCCRKDLYGNYRDVRKCQSWNQGPPGSQSGRPNEALYYRGCFDAGSEFANAYSGYVIAVGIGISALLVGSVVASASLYRAIPLGQYEGVCRRP